MAQRLGLGFIPGLFTACQPALIIERFKIISLAESRSEELIKVAEGHCTKMFLTGLGLASNVILVGEIKLETAQNARPADYMCEDKNVLFVLENSNRCRHRADVGCVRVIIGSFRFTIFASCERLPREANCVVKLALHCTRSYQRPLALARTGSKMRFQLPWQLKVAMLKTSHGSCLRCGR